MKSNQVHQLPTNQLSQVIKFIFTSIKELNPNPPKQSMLKIKDALIYVQEQERRFTKLMNRVQLEKN